jgi:hypothetical protein
LGSLFWTAQIKRFAVCAATVLENIASKWGKTSCYQGQCPVGQTEITIEFGLGSFNEKILLEQGVPFNWYAREDLQIRNVKYVQSWIGLVVSDYANQEIC